MQHINPNTLTRTIVPVSTISASRSLFHAVRTNAEESTLYLGGALGSLITHTSYVTKSEVDAVNDALDAIQDVLDGNSDLADALDVVDAAAAPLLSDHRFDPTAWTSETAEGYLHDGGYVLPEAPVGWSWETCSGCSVPVPVQDVITDFSGIEILVASRLAGDILTTRYLCDECLDTRWNAA